MSFKDMNSRWRRFRLFSMRPPATPSKTSKTPSSSNPVGFCVVLFPAPMHAACMHACMHAAVRVSWGCFFVWVDEKCGVVSCCVCCAVFRSLSHVPLSIWGCLYACLLLHGRMRIAAFLGVYFVSVLRTVLASKPLCIEAGLAGLLADAIASVMPPKFEDFDPDNIRVAKLQGGRLSQSTVLNGMVITKPPHGMFCLLPSSRLSA